MNRTAIAVLALLSSCGPVAAQRAVVCPPRLDYCYEKPILAQPRAEDEIARILAQGREDLKEIYRQHGVTDRGLDRELRRSRYCNSLYC